MNLYRAARNGTFFKTLLGREPFYWVNVLPKIKEFGSKYGRWAVDTTRLTDQTTLVSFGLGDDVTFEMELIERYGCRVFGFDPTPRSIEYIRKCVTHPRFVSYPYALADKNGVLEFTLPPACAADQTSASAVASYAMDSKRIQVPCLTLSTAQDRFGIQQIDILKIDIEGFEYKVIEQLIANDWISQVSQLLVEFHHFLPGIRSSHTRSAISKLRESGFQIAWIGRTNHEYLFTRTSGVSH